MGNLYTTIQALCQQRGIRPGKLCDELSISRGLITDLKMGRKAGVSAVTAQKIAGYFGVTVAYLLGEETENPSPNREREIRDADIKFALFGGDGEITDAMYDEVKRFAEMVMLRERQKRSENGDSSPL